MKTSQRLIISSSMIIILVTLKAALPKCDALLLKCPIYQMHMQKIVGFRPPLDYLTQQNLLYASPKFVKNRVERDSYTSDLVDDDAQPKYEPLTSRICWRICNEDDDCIAYVHLLDTNECYGFTYFDRTERYRMIQAELHLVADPEAIYFEKTCLKVPETCKSKFWTLTKIPGSSLIFQGKKTISTLVTRRECAEKCLFEWEFKCLSVSFAPSYRNNRERFGQLMTPYEPTETVGRCILSDRDKMIQADAFRAAPFDEEYIENQCYNRDMESDSCSYELYSNSSFIYAEAKYTGLTQKECQSYCTQESKFFCQGVTFSLEQDLSQSQCYLHSEDIISMGPRSLKLKVNSVYMRRVKCLDVQVICSHEEMAIKYTPKDWFRGKLYTSGHSTSCVAMGKGVGSTLLRLEIGSEMKESRCGILRAYEVTKDYQRIFISVLVVIQNNANVQTQGDRLVKVGCIMNNTSKTSNDSATTLSDEQEEDVPNAVALESSLEFTKQTLPNVGTVLYNISDQQFVPKIILQIVDVSRKYETNEVQMGQNLELQIVAEPPENLDRVVPALYDFRATSLRAKTMDDQNSVLLIDERGCPTDVKVFPALERKTIGSKNMLSARFHAFKFAGTSLVDFDVKISFCPHGCPEMNCLQFGSSTTISRGHAQRSRRQAALSDQHVHVQSPIYISTVMDVPTNATETVDNPSVNIAAVDLHKQSDFEMPLNFSLLVHGPDVPNSNSIIYGERGILLIASIEGQLPSDDIFINQSLLIALFIFWLCIQVALMFSCCYVVQKYKRIASLCEERHKIYENLEYLDGRRVHWADSQSGYTL